MDGYRRAVGSTNEASGWLAVRGEPAAPTYYVRCRDNGRGGAEINAVLVVALNRITSATLRDIPTARLEAVINTNPEILSAVFAAGKTPDPVLRLLQGTPEIPMVGRTITVTVNDTVAATDNVTVHMPRGDEAAEPPLTRPDRSDPVAFYGRIAERYKRLVTLTAKPGVAIAEEAGVPVATARRWINEARRRGLLPPGRAGRA
jgi:hypothetical protein